MLEFMFSEKIQHFEFVDFPFLIMVLYCNFIKIDFFLKKIMMMMFCIDTWTIMENC